MIIDIFYNLLQQYRPIGIGGAYHQFAIVLLNTYAHTATRYSWNSSAIGFGFYFTRRVPKFP